MHLNVREADALFQRASGTGGGKFNPRRLCRQAGHKGQPANQGERAKQWFCIHGFDGWNMSDYFATVRGTENPVFSHIIFKTPPPPGDRVTAMVNWSTGLSNASFFKSTRATSCEVSTGIPQPPRRVLMASWDAPFSSGTR